MSSKSIPRNSRVVKKAMLELLSHFSLECDELGVTSMEGMSVSSALEAFSVLLGAGRQASVSTKFRVGDLYNLLGKENPKARREALQEIKSRFSENDRQTIRTCGWVANKWPRDSRGGDFGWTHYIELKPGDVKKSATSDTNLPFFTAIESEHRDDGLWMECEGYNKKRIMVKAPVGMYEPVQDSVSR